MGITVPTKIERNIYTNIKPLLSHLVAKAVDAGSSAQSVWNLLVKEKKNLFLV